MYSQKWETLFLKVSVKNILFILRMYLLQKVPKSDVKSSNHSLSQFLSSSEAYISAIWARQHGLQCPCLTFERDLLADLLSSSPVAGAFRQLERRRASRDNYKTCIFCSNYVTLDRCCLRSNNYVSHTKTRWWLSFRSSFFRDVFI